MIYNPSIISQCLSSQLSYINVVYGQMFYVTDYMQIYYDTQDGSRERAQNIIILQYERDRNNYTPSNKEYFTTEQGNQIPSVLYDNISYVYVIETNCLYSYNNGTWTTLYGIYGSVTVAQTYLPNGKLINIVADDVTTNGILNDGSVVVRDNNKMICGQLKSDGYTFDILSLIGGCINIEPSGQSLGSGTLQLNAKDINNTSVANLNSDLVVFGKIRTTSPDNWSKQYRLVTEDIMIVSESLIKQGSTIIKGSRLGDVSYTKDTVLVEDTTCTSGLIVQGSKLYINTNINGQLLKPPFLFDDYSNNDIFDISIDTDVLSINTNNNFKSTGDSIYISTKGKNITNVKTLKFLNNSYNIDYISNEGIANTAKIVYYSNNTVKILP